MPPVLRNLSMRAGFGATGAIYFALGIVSARVAFLGTRKKEAGIPGALRFLLAQPYGDLLLGAVVAGLAAIAVVHLYEAAGKKRKGLFRLGLAINGIGYLTLAWAAARLLFHVEAGSGSLRKTGVTWLLAESWGRSSRSSASWLRGAGSGRRGRGSGAAFRFARTCCRGGS